MNEGLTLAFTFSVSRMDKYPSLTTDDGQQQHVDSKPSKSHNKPLARSNLVQNEDEEAKYSAVGRSGKDASEQGFDGRNDDTFGAGAPKEALKPWSGAANSVAAITGR